MPHGHVTTPAREVVVCIRNRCQRNICSKGERGPGSGFFVTLPWVAWTVRVTLVSVLVKSWPDTFPVTGPGHRPGLRVHRVSRQCRCQCNRR
jgi:hypothetical protein